MYISCIDYVGCIDIGCLIFVVKHFLLKMNYGEV